MILIKGHMRPLFCRMIFLNFRYFDQITTLTHVLMDNFCPCFLVFCRNLLQSRPDNVIQDNQGEPAVRILCAIPNIYDLNRRMKSYYTHFFMHYRQCTSAFFVKVNNALFRSSGV